MNKRKMCLLSMDALLAVLLIAFDQFTKQLAVTHLKGKPALPLISGVLELQYLENRGAAFGMFEGKKIIILIVGVIFVSLVVFFLCKLPEQKKYNIVHVLVAVVIAGGIGNMIDRFRLDYVVDFISFVLIHFPVFNVADIYVVLATIGLVVMFMFIFTDDDLDFITFQRKTKQVKK